MRTREVLMQRPLCTELGPLQPPDAARRSREGADEPALAELSAGRHSLRNQARRLLLHTERQESSEELEDFSVAKEHHELGF